MEIINAHVHLIELQGMIQRMGNVSLPADISVLKDLDRTLPLLKAEELLKQMDEAGVSQSVLYAVEAPFVYSSNAYVARICQKWPDRFIGFGSVNPLDSKASETLERAVQDLGFKGLKLHPPLQNFDPKDERAFPLYQKAQELNIPIVFHVGTTPFGCLCKLEHAAPMNLDTLAVNFPFLKIILTHLGTLAHHEAFMVVEKNPNVYIDTSAYLYEIRQLITSDLISRIGEDKLIFGTDYPMPFAGKVHRIKDFVDRIQGLDISTADKERIFSKNFKSMLAKDPRKLATVSAGDLMARLSS